MSGPIADAACGTTEADEICVSVVPSKEAVVVRRTPMIKTRVGGSELSKWIETHAFPGVWNLREGMFQIFNDQPIFKLLFAVVPEETQSATKLAECIDRFEGRVSFGIINGVHMKDVLTEFGIDNLPAILMLSDTRLDYDKYFNDLSLDTVCEDIEAALAGQKEMKFRGGLGTKIRYQWKRFLNFLGLESDIAKAGALLGSVVTITMLTAWALSSCFENGEKRKVD